MLISMASLLSLTLTITDTVTHAQRQYIIDVFTQSLPKWHQLPTLTLIKASVAPPPKLSYLHIRLCLYWYSPLIKRIRIEA